MPIPTLKQIFTDYRSRHLALPAFNIDSFEIYQAVEMAVAQTRLPCLVQLSAGEDQFIQAERLFMLVKKAQIDGLPIYLNMDHGQDISRLQKLATLGFDMLHFDGSTFDYQTNLSLASAFVTQAKQISPSILIEVEFNHIKSSQSGVDPSSFTDPHLASQFIKTCQADLLAISVGNLHGVDINLPEKIDLNLLSQIQKNLPQTFLVMHGGSGIDPVQLTQAINYGIVKININTDLRLNFRQSLESSLASSDTIKAYQYLEPAVTDLSSLVVKKLKAFANV
ncbi:class II fructose-bisphosphate aldolase [Patescibacteria group bacterium]|nr:class II fructose-bisphosphate aldolase [Patescibacteria group bacterium]